MDIMTQTEFAAFYDVSQPAVHKYIQRGKIPPECLVQDGKYKKILVDCAVTALSENLCPIKRKTNPDRDPLPGAGILPELQARERIIQFQPSSPEELADRTALVLDMLSYLSTFFDEGSHERIDLILDELAGLFDAELVNIAGLPGRRCVTLQD